jgi:hypothetical protein
VAKQESKALEKQGTQAVAAFDYGEDAGAGYEHQDSSDMSIPFLVVLQQMSPVVAENKIDGAKAGMIMNTATQQIWSNPDGLIFVPGTTRHEYTEFTPRDKGGGYKGKHSINSDVVAKALAENKSKGLDFGEYYTPDGNELVETFYVFGAICTPEGEAAGMGIMAFTSAKIKVYKMWMSVVRSFTMKGPSGDKVSPPLFAHLTRITTEMKKNEKGTFWVPVINPANKSIESSLLAPNDSRFQLAKACKELVDSGEAKVDYNQAKSEGDGSGDAGPAGRGKPF